MFVCLFYYMLTSQVLCGAFWHADVTTDYVHADYACTFLIHQGIHTYCFSYHFCFCFFVPWNFPNRDKKCPTPPKKQKKHPQKTTTHMLGYPSPPLSLCHVCLVQRKYRIKSYSKHLTGRAGAGIAQWLEHRTRD